MNNESESQKKSCKINDLAKGSTLFCIANRERNRRQGPETFLFQKISGLTSADSDFGFETEVELEVELAPKLPPKLPPKYRPSTPKYRSSTVQVSRSRIKKKGKFSLPSLSRLLRFIISIKFCSLLSPKLIRINQTTYWF